MEQVRARNWCFTLYPYNEADLKLNKFPWDPDTICWLQLKPAVSFLVCQLELCPKTNKEHWQGYVEFNNAVAFKSVKAAFKWNSTHLERRKGSRTQAITYCTKAESAVLDDGVPIRFLYGEIPAEKESKDTVFADAMEMETFDEAMQHVKKHAPRDYVIMHVQINNCMRKLFTKTMDMAVINSLKWRRPHYEKHVLTSKLIVMHGTSGSGKTNFALSHFKTPLLVRHIDKLKDLTTEHDGIVFDDLTFAHWPVSACIHLTDLAFDSDINVKHGMRTIPAGMPRFITTNEDVCSVFNYGNKEQRIAIERRTIRIHVCNALFTPQ
jgi:hypothetical protein